MHGDLRHGHASLSQQGVFAQLRAAIDFQLACRSLRLLLEPLDQGARNGRRRQTLTAVLNLQMT